MSASTVSCRNRRTGEEVKGGETAVGCAKVFVVLRASEASVNEQKIRQTSNMIASMMELR